MNQDRYRPDFESNFELPPWLDMNSGEESQSPNFSPFVDALKKRMRPQQPVAGMAGGMGAGAIGGAMGGDSMGALGKAAGGGPKSL